MNRPTSRVPLVVVIAFAAALAGCAVGGPSGDGAYVPRSEPAARMALRPEHKVFYDALTDYGDWDLVEPYGYVFRPRVDPLVWRPYSYGYWAPTDNFGWVWMSSDVFGWATDHYGRWLYDPYKQWVWVPGIDWGPAWVSWEMSDQYAGWAPLGPYGYNMHGAPIPGGPYLYAPLAQLMSTDVHAQAVTLQELTPAQRTGLEPVTGFIERDGAKLPAGPPIGRVERLTGLPITRARLDDAVPTGTPQDLLKRTNEGSLGAPRDGEAGGSNAGTRIEAIRRAALESARETQQRSAHPATVPSRIPVIRPFGVPGASPAPTAPSRPGAHAGAAADSTKH